MREHIADLSSLELHASHIRVPFLADLVDPASLPLRLRKDFAYRPWPTHDLLDKIVDPTFIPPAPEAATDTWPMCILSDRQLQIDGTPRSISRNVLHLLNLMLITRDWALRRGEYFALGFASYIENPKARGNLFNAELKRLEEKGVLFDNLSSSHDGAYRLNPAWQIKDLRRPKG